MKERKAKFLSVLLSACMVSTCAAGFNVSAGAAAGGGSVIYDEIAITDCTISVDVLSQSVEVMLTDGGIVPTSAYTIEYVKFLDDGTVKPLDNVFPTENGQYKAIVTAVEGSGFTGSDVCPFRIENNAVVNATLATITVDPVAKTTTVYAETGEAVPESAYTLTYEQRIVNGDPWTWAEPGFPTSDGTWFVIADAVSDSGYSGRVISDDFVIGYGTYATITVDPASQSVTVTDTNGRTVSPSQYELSFFRQLDGSEEYAGASFPTEKGIYVAVAKAEDMSGMIASLPFEVAGAALTELATITVDTGCGFVTVKDANGEVVPKKAYTLEFTRFDGTAPITLQGESYPTTAGVYVASAAGREDSGYTGAATSTRFEVKKDQTIEDVTPNGFSVSFIPATVPSAIDGSGYDLGLAFRWSSDMFVDCCNTFFEIEGGIVLTQNEIEEYKNQYGESTIDPTNGCVAFDWTAMGPQATQVPADQWDGYDGPAYRYDPNTHEYELVGHLHILGSSETKFDDNGMALGVNEGDNAVVKIYTESWNGETSATSPTRTVTLEYTEANARAGMIFTDGTTPVEEFDLGLALVEFDEQTKTFSVKKPTGETIPKSAYTETYYKENTDVGSTYPTEPGMYYWSATAVQGSGYIGGTTSKEFTVSASDYDLGNTSLTVDEESHSVSVRKPTGELVPSSAYVLSYYRESDMVGEAFPTTPGTYWALATAVKGSGYSGKVSSKEFTISEGEKSLFSDCSFEVFPGEKKVIVYETATLLKVPESAYTLTFFNKDTGARLNSFPTAPGNYMVGIEAVPGNGYKDSNGGPFTISEDKITVTYVTDDDIYALANYDKGSIIDAPPDPEMPALLFSGWFTDKAFTKAFDFSTRVYENLTLYAKLEAPVIGLTAKPGDERATLAWNKVDGAARYAAYLVQDDNTLKALATKLTDTTYTATKLTNGNTYKFVVRAYLNGKWTSYTENDIAVCTLPSDKPVVTATPGDKQATLTWGAVNDATRYAAYTVLEDGTLKALATRLETTEYTVNKLTNGTEYKFAVRAYVNGKWSAYDIVACTPVSAVVKPEVTATAGDKEVTLSWNDINATKYAAYLVQDDGTLKALATKLETTEYTAKKLTNGTEYKFVVRAYVNGKWTPYDESDYVKATPVSSVVKPEVTAEPADKQVTLLWNDIDATKYAVYIEQDDGTLKALATKLTVTEYTVKKLTNHTNYRFLVRAYINGKWTPYDESDYITAAPAALKPLVRTSSYDGMITLRWGEVDNATKYAAYIVNDDNTLTCVSSKITNVKYTVKNLTNGTTYRFVVRAYVDGKWTKYTDRDIVSAAPKAGNN